MKNIRSPRAACITCLFSANFNQEIDGSDEVFGWQFLANVLFRR
jgi:hypothetical protein